MERETLNRKLRPTSTTSIISHKRNNNPPTSEEQANTAAAPALENILGRLLPTVSYYTFRCSFCWIERFTAETPTHSFMM